MANQSNKSSRPKSIRDKPRASLYKPRIKLMKSTLKFTNICFAAEIKGSLAVKSTMAYLGAGLAGSFESLDSFFMGETEQFNFIDS